MMNFCYRYDGTHYLPSELVVSPWDRRMQNGVAIGGLIAHLTETLPGADMVVARLTIDILAATPLVPTIGRARVVRDGRRIQMVEAELVVEDRVCARGTALRVREATSPSIGSSVPARRPDDAVPTQFMRESFGASLEARLPPGTPARTADTGHGALWTRFGHQVVEGIPLSPLVRVASFADFGTGVGQALSFADWSFANLDIAVHLDRLPRGAWLLLEAETHSAGNGVAIAIAIASGVMSDVDGAFARTHQTLFVASRDRAGARQ